ncbi:MAG TPA: nitrite reductase large subunit NirB [Candidatus Dormibacteraeota bacterium]
MTAPGKRLAVVGNGMISVSLLDQLVRLESRWRISVFGDEPHPAYDRIGLSQVLAGDRAADDLPLRDRDWYASHGVELHTGCRVLALDAERCRLATARGDVDFDACVLATGSLPFVPPIPGAGLDGVLGFRTIEDVDAMLERARTGRSAVVIGGGLLGLEAARGLLARGMQVTVVHLVDRLMERQLDDGAAGLVREELERMGLRVLLPASTRRIEGEGRVEAVVLDGGAVLPADLVVICAGIKPNVALAAAAGLDVGRGVRVDDRMATSAPAVHAIGECAEHDGVTYGLVPPLHEQAAVLASQLAGDGAATFRPLATAARLKVAGIDVFAGGRTTPEAGDQEVLLRDDGGGVYKKLVLRDDALVGVALVGDLGPMAAVSDALTRGGRVRDRLALLGVGAAVGPPPGADLADDAVVCGCNGVTRAAIVAAIGAEGGCTTRECVARRTRASSSCGSCAPVVDGLLQLAGMGRAAAPDAPDVCTCVPLPRAALRERVLGLGLRSVSEVLERLGDGVGCHRCRPALSYYLDVWWCGEHREEPASRHVNDRVHANIQRDGTFSVVPRIRGGVTSPAELRRIADVAERYQVGAVKITGGQRIDLLGVRKEDLPAVWTELGMPSGHAYTKAVRTVKSCVGTDWCRYGVGDSTDLAVRLESALEGLYTPHKLKLGVTGCPRNCAEVTVKDLGIVAVVGGWELYVAGAAGMTVRKGDLLCTVATPEQALEEAAIAVQHYREQAEYLERMYHFVPRVGIEAFRAATVDATAGARRGLLERFRRSRDNARDPWRSVPASDPSRFRAPLALAEEPAP